MPIANAKNVLFYDGTYCVRARRTKRKEKRIRFSYDVDMAAARSVHRPLLSDRPTIPVRSYRVVLDKH